MLPYRLIEANLKIWSRCEFQQKAKKASSEKVKFERKRVIVVLRWNCRMQLRQGLTQLTATKLILTF